MKCKEIMVLVFVAFVFVTGLQYSQALQETVLDVEVVMELPQIALTFDDGPHPKYTSMLLDGLQERDVRVTFFIIGMYAAEHPEIIKRMHDEGHLLGNHTYNHVEITSLSNEEAYRELMDTSDLIYEITGARTEFLRPPFGVWKKKLEEQVDVVPVLWTVDPLDWTTENANEVVRKVVNEVEEGDIILLHDRYESSVNAALRIVDILLEEGFEFVTVDELLMR